MSNNSYVEVFEPVFGERRVLVAERNILTLIIFDRGDGSAEGKISAGVITGRGPSEVALTPWMRTGDAEAALRVLTRVLATAMPGYVVRWDGSTFVSEDA